MDYETVTAGWSRKCGYRFYSYYDIPHSCWSWTTADNGGNYTFLSDFSTEHRCNCPTKYGPYKPAASSYYYDTYTAVCQDDGWISASSYATGWNGASSADWVRSHTCPKGWGKYWDDPASKTGPYVQCAQGYVPDGYKEPIYGYVTRYRDAWYDFYSTRVAKI